MIVLPAAIASALGLFMMLPAVRRRAAEGGFSGSVAVPALITCAGLACLAVGLLMGG